MHDRATSRSGRSKLAAQWYQTRFSSLPLTPVLTFWVSVYSHHLQSRALAPLPLIGTAFLTNLRSWLERSPSVTHCWNDVEVGRCRATASSGLSAPAPVLAGSFFLGNSSRKSPQL